MLDTRKEMKAITWLLSRANILLELYESHERSSRLTIFNPSVLKDEDVPLSVVIHLKDKRKVVMRTMPHKLLRRYLFGLMRREKIVVLSEVYVFTEQQWRDRTNPPYIIPQDHGQPVKKGPTFCWEFKTLNDMPYREIKG